MIPEPPIPQTTRPTISIVEDRATPHSSEPISNTARKLMKATLKEKYAYVRPARGINAHCATRYPDAYHDMSLIVSNLHVVSACPPYKDPD